MSKPYHLGLVGFPIEHSLSPRLHGAALRACGIAGDYKLFSIVDLPEGEKPLSIIIKKIKNGDLDGVNVTIPHKRNITSFLDKLSSTALSVGAVNTIYKKNALLWGENTDVAGFMNDLRRVGVDQRENQMALILGAGGAARAATWGLLSNGWRVCLMARRVEQAQQVVEWIGKSSLAKFPPGNSQIFVLRHEIESLRQLVSTESIQLIVNATPLGMASQPKGAAWPEEIAFPMQAVVYDLVYKPGETELIRLARRAGLTAFNGVGMLVEQAALAFEIWTGMQAPREVMWQAVEHIQEK
ncbi:MAG: shikimate dehydrogenase [Anaerolineales bacterium]|nr:shikimate dehydrogenase [Anaerolineales bacterium]